MARTTCSPGQWHCDNIPFMGNTPVYPRGTLAHSYNTPCTQVLLSHFTEQENAAHRDWVPCPTQLVSG